jgi:hypothetical protein
MGVTLLQKRLASVGVVLMLVLFTVTLVLLSVYGGHEIQIRRSPGPNSGVSSGTVTIGFVTLTLVLYLLSSYWLLRVMDDSPFNPFWIGNNRDCTSFKKLLFRVYIITTVSFLIDSFTTNIQMFGFLPQTPLQWIVFVYAFPVLTPLTVCIVGVALIGLGYFLYGVSFVLCAVVCGICLFLRDQALKCVRIWFWSPSAPINTIRPNIYPTQFWHRFHPYDCNLFH